MNHKHASEVFWNTFLGEYVSIVYGASDAKKHGIIECKGYLLDIDELYYYLGYGPLAVDMVIKKQAVDIIEIIKEQDESLQVLENLPVPEDEEGKN